MLTFRYTSFTLYICHVNGALALIERGMYMVHTAYMFTMTGVNLGACIEH